MKSYDYNKFLASFRHIAWKSLAVDIIFYASFYGVFILFTNYFKNKINSIGIDEATLQQLMGAADPAPFAAAISTLRGFLVVYVISIILFILLFVTIFSLSRAYIWCGLLHKKLSFKRYVRWNWLALILSLFAIIYLFLGLLVKLLLMAISKYVFTSIHILQSISSLINFALILIYIIIILLTFYHFTHSYKVFESLGKSFSTIKKKWKKLWPFFLFSLAVAFLPVIVTLPWIETLSFYPNEQVWFSAIFTFVYLAWLRGYLLLTIDGNKSNS